MWKKNETVESTGPLGAQRREPLSRASGGGATIGRSISIRGELEGAEDLRIDGRLEGKVTVDKHNVTIGAGGRVEADVRGRRIRVEGEVEGNLFGDEEVVICESGKVNGNITAPQVSLEKGSAFKGSIDMGRRPSPTPPKEASAGRTPTAEGAEERSTKALDGQAKRLPGLSGTPARSRT